MNQYTIDGDDYYHNDMVNALRSQYMAMTFQPVFDKYFYKYDQVCDPNETKVERHHASRTSKDMLSTGKKMDKKLVLEQMIKPVGIQTTVSTTPKFASKPPSTWKYLSLPPVPEKEPAITTHQPKESTATPMESDSVFKKPAPPTTTTTSTAIPKRRKVVTGSLIHADGTTETQTAQTL
jgi:hypothetical protein